MGPEPLVEVLARQWSGQVSEQTAGQTVLTFREVDRFARAGNRQLSVIKGQVIEALHFMGGRLLQAMPTQNRRDPCFQFIRTERFADVIIGATVERGDDVALGITAGEHDDGRWRLHVFAGPAQQRDAGDVRQLPVEYQQVEGFPAQLA